MAKRHLLSFITICSVFLICPINSSLTQGYFYDNPIRPFNPTSFPPLRSTGGQYSSIPYGQKVESTTRLKVPPIPTLPPLTTYIPTQTPKYQSQSSAYARVPTTTPRPYNPQQQVPRFQQPQQTQTQYQKPQQQVPQPYSYPKPQVQLVNTPQNSYTTSFQQGNNIPQSTKRPVTQFYQTTTPSYLAVQRQTPRPSYVPQQVVPQQVVPQQVVPQQVVPQKVVTQQVVPQKLNPPQVVAPQQAVTASFVDIPTVAVINSDSNNPSQTSVGLVASPDIYVVDGRQLKQYKVYEHIDNDIDQEVHNFLPANFFLNSYHSMIGDTHPLGEEIQVQNRASGVQPRSQLVQQPALPNTVALGSGGLGFVKLPNGNVYLGSGSLGYISSLQHSQDVQDLRSRTSSSGPDALHFGHGALSDSFYYQNQKD